MTLYNRNTQDKSNIFDYLTHVLYTYQPVEILSIKGLLFLCVNKIILDLYSRMFNMLTS
jgi:hypothetical protein